MLLKLPSLGLIRKKRKLVAIAILLTTLLFYIVHHSASTTELSFSNWRNQSKVNKNIGSTNRKNRKGNIASSLKTKDDFYAALFNGIAKCKPSNPILRNLAPVDDCDLSNISGDTTNEEELEKLSYKYLSHCYPITKNQIEELRKNHEKFVDILHTTLDISDALFNKIYPNEKGIVTIGGGRFSVLAFTNIKVLREIGNTLPVEVFIPPQDEDGEEEFCENFLPKMNAKCVFVKDVLPPLYASNLIMKSYQIKIYSLLFSSFKHTLFLDSDNFALKNLDKVFDYSPYPETGMILWPDIWRRATAPVFYKIADIPIDLNQRVRYGADDISPPKRYRPSMTPEESVIELTERVPLHDLKGTIPDVSTESGQIMVNKKTHLKTLLLAAYYNFYGPSWYYRMFSQGTAGEGDKETFIAAAAALGNSWYQVKSPVGFDGYWPHDGGFMGIMLMQHDFKEDYEHYKDAAKFVSEHRGDFDKYKDDYKVSDDFYKSLLKTSTVGFMFGHNSFFKYDPLDLYKENKYLDEYGNHVRGLRQVQDIMKFDIELFSFSSLFEVLCLKEGTPDGIQFAYYREAQTTNIWDDVCVYLQTRVEYLRETTEY